MIVKYSKACAYRCMQTDHCRHVKDPAVLAESVDYGNNKIIIIIIIIIITMIIMNIYHALINALSAHMIHINLDMIFYTHVEHSPTKTIYIKYYKKMEKK